ncbi:MAG: hypothetical protein ACRDKL_09835 [Solirubrobacteraceae bacterium]
MQPSTRRPSRSRRRRDLHSRPTPAPPDHHAPAERADAAVGGANPHQRGGRVIFEVPLRSAMGGADLELLRRQLEMTAHVDHKLPADPNSPAIAQLDDESSVILEHGEDSQAWLLQGRTWGSPSDASVHAWHVRSALVAHQLDAGVELPQRLAATAAAPLPQRPVGRAATARLAHLRRRLVGLA